MNPVAWWAVLDALNVASTQYRRGRGYEATAAEVAETLATDDRMRETWAFTLTRPQVSAVLGQLARQYYARPPMVERVPGSRSGWRMTNAGARWSLGYSTHELTPPGASAPTNHGWETCPSCEGRWLMTGDGCGMDGGGNYHDPGCPKCDGQGAIPTPTPEEH